MKRELQAAKLKPGAPEKPAGLSALAAKEWDRLVREMHAAGITLSPAYRAMIAQASTLSADIITAWEALERDGHYVTNKQGDVKAHPALAHLTACRNRLVFVLIQLGLSPKAQPAQDTPEDDALGRLLKGRRPA